MSLKEAGYLILPDYLESEDLSRLEQYFEDAPGSGVLIEMHPSDLPYWLEELSGRIAREIELAAGRACPLLEKVWFQRSTSSWTSEQHKAVPFLPHIDKRRYLKAMLYVSDVNKESGAMETSALPPQDYERMRRRLPRDYKERGLNLIDLPPDSFFPLSGPKGTTILFDTNTPHHAGAVAPGSERRIVRLDFGPL